MAVNIIKLCVGIDSVEELAAFQASRYGAGKALPRHVTRMRPKREAELLDGGSLYWVIKGLVLARQKLVGLEDVRGADGIERCALLLDREIIRTHPLARRPFQGWRYLTEADAPQDLDRQKPEEEDLPPALLAALSDIGVR